MGKENGEKSRLYAILGIILLGLMTWAASTLVSHGERITKVETSEEDIKAWMKGVRDDMKSMSGKMDQVLERRR